MGFLSPVAAVLGSRCLGDVPPNVCTTRYRDNCCEQGLSLAISECDDLALAVKRGLLLELESRSELYHSRASASETRIALCDVWGLS